MLCAFVLLSSVACRQGGPTLISLAWKFCWGQCERWRRQDNPGERGRGGKVVLWKKTCLKGERLWGRDWAICEEGVGCGTVWGTTHEGCGVEEEEEGHLLLAEGSFFTLCQVQHHHHYAQHKHYYYHFLYLEADQLFFHHRGILWLYNIKKNSKCYFWDSADIPLSRHFIALAIKTHHGISPVVRQRSAVSSWLIGNDPA